MKRKASAERPKFQLKKKKPNPDAIFAQRKVEEEKEPEKSYVKVSYEVGESIEFKVSESDGWTPGYIENTDPLQVVSEKDPENAIEVSSDQIRIPHVEKKKRSKADKSKSRSKPAKKKDWKDMTLQELRLELQDYQVKEKNQARYISVMQNKHDALQLKYDDAESDVDRLRKRLKSAQSDLKDSKDDLRRAKDKLEKRDKELDSIEKEHEASTREVVDATIELDDKKKRIKIQDDVIQQLSEKVNKLNGELQKVQAETKVDGYGSGAYSFVDGTIVRTDYSLESELVRQVEPGETVSVSQCVRHSRKGRHLIRGKIHDGWVTLANLTAGIVFASPVNEDWWRQQLQEKTSANQILEMRNEQLEDRLKDQTEGIQKALSLEESLQNLEQKYNSLHTSYENAVAENVTLRDKCRLKESPSLTEEINDQDNDLIKKLTKELEDANSVNDDLRNEIDVYRQDSDVHATIRNQRDLAREALKQRNEQYMTLESDYEQAKKDILSLRDRISRIREDHDDIQESLRIARRAEDNHKQVIASYAKQLAQVEDLRKKGHAAGATELKLQKAKRTIEQLNRKIDRMDRGGDKLKQYDRKLKALKEEYEKSQKDLAQANQTVVNLRKKNLVIKDKKEQYETSAIKRTEKYKKEKAANDNLRRDLSTAQSTLKTLEEENRLLRKGQDTLERELIEKKSELYELLNSTPEKRVADLQVILNMKDDEIRKLRNEVQSLQAKNEILDSELEDTSNDLKDKQKKLNAQQLELEESRKRENQRIEQVKSIRAECLECTNRVESIEKEYIKVKNELAERRGNPEICNIGGVSILEENQSLKIAQTEIGLLRQENERLRGKKPKKSYSRASENENLREQLLSLLRKLKEAEEKYLDLEAKCKDLQLIADKHRDQAGIQELQYQNKSLQAENERLIADVVKLHEKIESHETDIRDLNKELKKSNRNESQAKLETQDFLKTLDKERGTIKKLQEQIKRLELQIKTSADEVKRALQGKVASDRKLHEDTEKFRKDFRDREERHRNEIRDLRERYEKEVRNREEKYMREKKEISAKKSMNQFAGQHVHMMRANLEKATRDLKTKDQELRDLQAKIVKHDIEKNELRESLALKAASFDILSKKANELERRLKLSVGETLERAIEDRERARQIAQSHQQLFEKANKDKEALKESYSSLAEMLQQERKAAEMATKLLEIAQDTENAQAKEIVLLQNHVEDLTKGLVVARKTSEKAEEIEAKSEELMRALTRKRDKVSTLETRVRELEHQCSSISGHFELHSRELTGVKQKLQLKDELILKKDEQILSHMKEIQICRVKARENSKLERRVKSLEKELSETRIKLIEVTKLAGQKQKALKAQLDMIQRRERELKFLKDTQAQHIKEKGELSSDIEVLKIQLEQKERDLEKLKGKHKSDESDSDKYRGEIESFKKQVATLQNALSDIKEIQVEIDRVPEGSVHISRKTAAEFVLYIFKLQKNNEVLKEENQENYKKLNDAIASKEKADMMARVSIDSAKASDHELKGIKEYIHKVGQENATLRHKISSSQFEIDEFKLVKKDLEKEVDHLTSQINGLKEQIEKFESEENSKEDSKAQEDLRLLKERLNEREAEFMKLNSEMDYLHHYAAESHADNSEVHKAHRECFKCLEHLRARSKIVFQTVIDRIKHNPNDSTLDECQREVRNFLSEHLLENLDPETVGVDYYTKDTELEDDSDTFFSSEQPSTQANEESKQGDDELSA